MYIWPRAAVAQQPGDGQQPCGDALAHLFQARGVARAAAESCWLAGLRPRSFPPRLASQAPTQLLDWHQRSSLVAAYFARLVLVALCHPQYKLLACSSGRSTQSCVACAHLSLELQGNYGWGEAGVAPPWRWRKGERGFWELEWIYVCVCWFWCFWRFALVVVVVFFFRTRVSDTKLWGT